MTLRLTLAVEAAGVECLETGGLETALFLDAPRVSVDKLTWKLERLDSDGDEDRSVVVVDMEDWVAGFFLSAVDASFVDAVDVPAALTSLLRKLGAI